MKLTNLNYMDKRTVQYIVNEEMPSMKKEAKSLLLQARSCKGEPREKLIAWASEILSELRFARVAIRLANAVSEINKIADNGYHASICLDPYSDSRMRLTMAVNNRRVMEFVHPVVSW